MPATKKKKSHSKTPAPVAKTRRLKRPKHRSFKLEKRIKHPAPALPGAFRLLISSLKHLWRNKKIYLLLTLVYALLTITFVKGFSMGTSLSSVKTLTQSLFGGGSRDVATGLTLLSYLIGTSGSTAGQVASVYQSILLIVMSLAIIWTLRQKYADQKVRLRDTFYKSQYPLVPFILVLMVIALQLLPLVIANALYGFVFGNGLAITAAEKGVWIVLFFLLALLSLYWVASSIFALYIVTLPDMTPIKALKSANDLVRYRRWTLMRKVVFMPIALLVILSAIGLPLIFFLTSVAQWTFFLVSMLGLLMVHTYMYNLYRELL